MHYLFNIVLSMSPPLRTGQDPNCNFIIENRSIGYVDSIYFVRNSPAPNGRYAWAGVPVLGSPPGYIPKKLGPAPPSTGIPTVRYVYVTSSALHPPQPQTPTPAITAPPPQPSSPSPQPQPQALVSVIYFFHVAYPVAGGSLVVATPGKGSPRRE